MIVKKYGMPSRLIMKARNGEEVDPARMYQIKAELDASGIYLSEELQRFCSVYFKPKQKQSAQDHQAMNAALDPAVSRFTAFRTDHEAESEIWRGNVRHLLAYTGSEPGIPYQDSDLEQPMCFSGIWLPSSPAQQGTCVSIR